MYVCICNAITDTDITQALEAGAKDLTDIKQTLGVANNCGSCAWQAHDIIKAHISNKAANNTTLYYKIA